jgi:hypothetical protein
LGPLKPDATALNVTVCPGVTVELGESDWIDSEACALTVICSSTVAVSPCESLTVIVRLCVPTSLLFGVQLKLPDELMSPVEAVPLANESLRAYVGLLKPDADTVNETFVPTLTLVLGESDCMETETLAYAKLNGKSNELNPNTSAINFFI